MTYDFQLACDLPATPQAIYEAWLSRKGNTGMTGAEAEVFDTPGPAYSAWDGYIEGRKEELVPCSRIVQTWRTSQFPDGHADSIVAVELAPIPSGARLTLTHRGVPDGQTSYVQGGWLQYDFEPMRAYLTARRQQAE